MTIFIISFFITIVFWLWIIRKYDRFEREPLMTVVFIFGVGGLISSFPAGICNQIFSELIGYDFSADSEINYGVHKIGLFYGFVGLNEEFWKAFATVVLIRRMKEFDEPADGLVYGMSVAFGFSVFENFDYADTYGLTTFIFRQINAVPLHIGLAAIWGIGITRAKFVNNGRYFKTMLPYVIFAALIHAAYNLSTTHLVNPLLSLIIPSVIAIILILFAVRKIKSYSVQGPFSDRTICNFCQTPNYPDSRLCVKCGKKLGSEFFKICDSCNSKVNITDAFCRKCGATINQND